MDAPYTTIEAVAPGTIGLLSCLGMDDTPRLRRTLQERGFWWLEVRRPSRCDILYGPQSLGPDAFRLVDAALSPQHNPHPRESGHSSEPSSGNTDRTSAPVILRVQSPEFRRTALEWARAVAEDAGWSVLEAQSGVLWAEVMPLLLKSVDDVKRWLDQHNVAYEMADNGSTWSVHPTALIPGKELTQEARAASGLGLWTVEFEDGYITQVYARDEEQAMRVGQADRRSYGRDGEDEKEMTKADWLQNTTAVKAWRVQKEARTQPPLGHKPPSKGAGPRVDLRTEYDDKHLFRNGSTLYRRGKIFQIWYPDYGPETWTLPTDDEEETESCFTAFVDQLEVGDVDGALGERAGFQRGDEVKTTEFIFIPGYGGQTAIKAGSAGEVLSVSADKSLVVVQFYEVGVRGVLPQGSLVRVSRKGESTSEPEAEEGRASAGAIRAAKKEMDQARVVMKRAEAKMVRAWNTPREEKAREEWERAADIHQAATTAWQKALGNLPEQAPATHSQCDYFASIKERKGWGRCSELDRDVPADGAVCSAFEVAKTEGVPDQGQPGFKTLQDVARRYGYTLVYQQPPKPSRVRLLNPLKKYGFYILKSPSGVAKKFYGLGEIEDWMRTKWGDIFGPEDIGLEPPSEGVSESRWTRLASTDEQEEAIAKLERLLSKLGKPIVGGTTVGKHPQGVVLDLTHQGGEISIGSDGGVRLYRSPAGLDLGDIQKALGAEADFVQGTEEEVEEMRPYRPTPRPRRPGSPRPSRSVPRPRRRKACKSEDEIEQAVEQGMEEMGFERVKDEFEQAVDKMLEEDDGSQRTFSIQGPDISILLPNSADMSDKEAEQLEVLRNEMANGNAEEAGGELRLMAISGKGRRDAIALLKKMGYTQEPEDDAT